MSLPIDAIQGAFREALEQRGRVVVTAPTGSGKSTRVPLWCRRWGRVLVVEPRRLACRSLARWVAKGQGEAPGGSIGYAVRHEARYTPETQVVYATPGTVVRMLQGGPLPFDVLVLDEFHERQVDVDLVLALAQARGQGKLVLMSATLAARRLAGWLDAELIEGEGRTFPVSLSHTEQPPLPSERDLADRVRDAVQGTLEAFEGDVLVFLPGKGEIGACARALASCAAEVLPLHGGSSRREQESVFRETGPRRVVLATNVAETSITLPRVEVVIDSGLVRQTRYHHGRSVLRLVPVAADAAEQRRGRAGRVGPGHCVRLWNAAAKLDGVTSPEIHRSELADATLAVAAAGFSMSELRFPDPPETYMLESARNTLERLGCLNDEGITPIGKLVARRPLDARLARFMAQVEQDAPHLLDDAAALVAALSAGRSILLPTQADPSDERRAWSQHGCDATALICAVYDGVAERDALRPEALGEARKIHKQLGGTLQRGRTPDRLGLARAAIRADPAMAFVRRKRGSRLGGPRQEVAPGRDTLLAEDAEAAVVYETYAVQARGTKVIQHTTCASPVPLAVLRSAGLGTPEFDRVWIKRETLHCAVRMVYGGVVIDKRELVPSGLLAAEALRFGVAKGQVFREAVAKTRDRAATWALFRGMDRRGDLRAFDAETWLQEAPDRLGFEAGEDFALLSPEDFVWPWPAELTEAHRERLSRQFPLRVDIGDASYRCTYAPARRVVTLELIHGRRKEPPPLSYLPSWTGWAVHLKRASNVRILRDR